MSTPARCPAFARTHVGDLLPNGYKPPPMPPLPMAPNGRPAPQLPNGRMNLKEGRSLGSYVNHANAAD